MDLQSVKQRFGIIGNSEILNRAIDKALQVAPTDISVLITGESGSGKESFPKIIHQFSSRKHGPFIAVNCGAIPEGTIDSELFGHEKGSFTGATDSRKGYFEEVNGGTIFLDEVAELPLATQVRLLRVLESGEFLKVGSSKVIKTDVRVVAATNLNVDEAITQGKFREDLYYRLNTVPIYIPPLRERKDDIILLFRKFAADMAEKYHMPVVRLTEDAKKELMNYRWPGNVRQLKNITEQLAILEKEREIDAETIRKYLPGDGKNTLPILLQNEEDKNQNLSERELLYKILFDMRKDINDLKKVVFDLNREEDVRRSMGDERYYEMRSRHGQHHEHSPRQRSNVPDIQHDSLIPENYYSSEEEEESDSEPIQDSEIIEESLSLKNKEIDLINRALEKHNGKRKQAAKELGISERTLYRKIKEYNIS
ncbi:MAG: sigma-54 dependent transcriptional regulator [Bacteroidales bacterium]|nr:sigma-54 dependent transcriptional regulator [Bacteroidales bacterium]MCF8327486.1 sigma-54 dependent transcriptional regulator [Bacteroidales bacterium]